MTDEQYSLSVMNLANPRTPQKRAAIVDLITSHPCKRLFEAAEELYSMEDELGNDIDEKEDAPLTNDKEEDQTNPAHQRIIVSTIFFYEDHQIYLDEKFC